MSMSDKKTFQAAQKDKGLRLDKFLKKQLKSISRSQIKKMIKQGLVLLNGKKTAVHCFLKEGDAVVVKSEKENKMPSPVVSAPKKTRSAKHSPNIIFEDDDFLIIDKPAGMLVHPTDNAGAINELPLLTEWVIKKYPNIEKVGEQKYRAGIIHRLDRDVSGIMIVAKTKEAFDHLKEQFKNRKVAKEYLAIIYGKMEKLEGEIDLPIGRSRDGKFVAHPRIGKEKFQDTDKSAKTLFWVKDYVKDFTVLKIKIVTGRTHQIRAHLSAIGHPIVGDQMYKPKKNIFKLFSKRIKVVETERIMLHSRKIGFYDMENNWREFEAPTPKELEKFLGKFKT